MDRKVIMGIAAVAGIGLLLYMRKQGDSATLGGSSSLVSAASGLGNWAAAPIVINTSTKPNDVPDTTASGQPPARRSDPIPVNKTPPAYSGVQAAAPASSSSAAAPAASRWANFADEGAWGGKK